jgi:RNA polymerase sigma-70 factor, ECF subfamily
MGAERARSVTAAVRQPERLLVRVHDVPMRGPSKDLSDEVGLEDFESFFRREHPRLLALAVALVGDREVARELVQESLLRAFSSWPKIVQLERPGGWTRRVLVNLCVDIHRRRGRERRAFERSASVSAIESPELPSADFWESVRRLPRLQRSVVVLHYVDDLSVMEVAEVLGVSSGSVKTSLSRARASLAPSLTAHVRGETDHESHS